MTCTAGVLEVGKRKMIQIVVFIVVEELRSYGATAPGIPDPNVHQVRTICVPKYREMARNHGRNTKSGLATSLIGTISNESQPTFAPEAS
jgi:hypothetical protein